MFFVGIFSSPLPYLLLLGVYMSGFALLNLKQENMPVSGGIVAVGEASASYFNEGTAAWENAPKVSCQETPLRFFIKTQARWPLRAVLFLSPQHVAACNPIRPPPAG